MGRKDGFTLVELMIVVVILGILAAIAIPLYMKFVQQSKTGEAQGNLAKIATLVEEYFAKSSNQASVATIVPGSSTGLIAKFPNTTRTGAATCDATPAVNAESVPRAAASVVKSSYQPNINEWACTTAGAGACAAANVTAWAQMKFELSSPIRYVYCYAALTPDTGTQTFQVIASSDLDGDGVWSRFTRRGQTGADGAIQIGALAVVNDNE